MRIRIRSVRLGMFMFAAVLESGCGSPVAVSEFVEVPAAGAVLAATIDFPSGEGPFPTIVFAHGSGRTIRQTEEGTAKQYVREGFAVVRYDKRGVGESTGQYVAPGAANSETIFPILASDLAAIVDSFRLDARVDSDRIGVLGPSQAGWLMPLAASITDHIAFIVSISGAASSVGVSDYFDGIAEGRTHAELADSLEAYDGVQGFDPEPYLRVLDIPALWVYGGEDRSNPTANDIQILERVRMETGNDLTIHLFERGTHGMRDFETGTQLPAVPECIVPWLLERFGGSDEILDFLKFASLVAGIPDNTIIVMLGDNMDNDYMMEFSLLSRLYSSLLDYPQHVCVFPEDLRWCFEFSFEQDLHFGYAPPEGWKRQRSRIRGTRA